MTYDEIVTWLAHPHVVQSAIVLISYLLQPSSGCACSSTKMVQANSTGSAVKRKHMRAMNDHIYEESDSYSSWKPLSYQSGKRRGKQCYALLNANEKRLRASTLSGWSYLTRKHTTVTYISCVKTYPKTAW